MREKGKTLPQTLGHVMCSHCACLRGAVLVCAGAKLIGVVIGQFLEACSNYVDSLRRLIGHLVGLLISQVFGGGLDVHGRVIQRYVFDLGGHNANRT